MIYNQAFNYSITITKLNNNLNFRKHSNLHICEEGNEKPESDEDHPLLELMYTSDVDDNTN